jgi:large subunit ribosomal protein L21
MFAIVQIGSAQFKVSEGDVITPNRLTADKGADMTLDKVLLYSNGEDIRIGQPFLNDVKVTASVVKNVLDEKVIAFKFRRRKRYSKIHGHRQKLTALNITKISAK